MKLARNASPMNIEANLIGATLLINDRLTGDKYSSPVVSKRRCPISHQQLALLPAGVTMAATLRTMNEEHAKAQPMAILATLPGSRPPAICLVQRHVMTGVSNMMKSGLIA